MIARGKKTARFYQASAHVIMMDLKLNSFSCYTSLHITRQTSQITSAILIAQQLPILNFDLVDPDGSILQTMSQSAKQQGEHRKYARVQLVPKTVSPLPKASLKPGPENSYAYQESNAHDVDSPATFLRAITNENEPGSHTGGTNEQSFESKSLRSGSRAVTCSLTADTSVMSRSESPLEGSDQAIVETDMRKVEVHVGQYTKAERVLKIQRFKRKKARAKYNRKVMYKCRKDFADMRPRVGGRFVGFKSRNTANPKNSMVILQKQEFKGGNKKKGAT